MKIILLFSALMGISLALTQCAVPPEGGAAKDGGMSATKEAPFVNSLGMKFVPVPGTKILMCTTETTVAQYQAAGFGYTSPPFSQASNHPAVNVSWNDAKAWCARLSKKEGRRYRLPTDAEWSAAVGTGTYPWGNQWPPPNNAGNYMGQEHKSSAASVAFFQSLSWKAGQLGVIGGFRDGHVFTAPVGSYPANGLGIHDLGGNVWEWCEDKKTKYSRMLRGSCWAYGVREILRSSYPGSMLPDIRGDFAGGFRCVVVR